MLPGLTDGQMSTELPLPDTDSFPGTTMRSCVILLILSAVVAVVGCATPGFLTGSVSTAFYAEPQGQKEFVIFQPDSLSLRDKQISDLIAQKLVERGYVKASSQKAANTAVLFKYSVGQGTVDVTSSPDFVWGGQKVESTTRYPRFFQLVIVDLQPEKNMFGVGPRQVIDFMSQCC